jgi:membrane-bound lytic murein transglycosylase F
MRAHRLLLLGLLIALLCACSEPTPDASKSALPETDAKPEAPQHYEETGDLPQLRQHGRLRLLAPRFDGADALPRDGIPVYGYQQVAAAFAKHLALDVQWVFVDAFDELIPMLRQGRGDLIVTNLTVTEQRQQQVAFSRPINRVSEVVISRQSLDSLEQLAGLHVSVPAGTTYLQSLQQLQQKQKMQLQLSLAPSHYSDSDMLSGLLNGEYDATVLDSDVANVLLLDHPQLFKGPTLKRARAIAWATRQNNPLLQAQLNQFLVAHHLQASAHSLQHRDWQQVVNSGRLRMLTLNNPASYFMWRGELMGFDLDLMRKFAQQHQLHVSVILKDNIDELIQALKDGEGDVIAASLTRSQQREAMGLVFSEPYLRVSEQLVGSLDSADIDDLQQLAGKRVGVNPATVFYSHFLALQKQGIEFEIATYPQASTENLIDKLVQGEFDYTAADSHLVALENTHRGNLKAIRPLSEQSDISWGLRPDQPQLRERLNGFIEEHYRGLFYNVTYNKYFKNRRRIEKHQSDRVVEGSALSPYDELIKPLAKAHGMDWRLLVAQMYQESKFDPKAVSFAGARGLMQVMPRTAKEMGYQDLDQPRNGIAAGIAYMHWLEQRFPGELDLQERVFFTLAAYNAGAGHVRDARRLALQQGLDPNRWFDHVEKAMLMLSKPEYYRKARFGYVRGSEPVHYVKSIRDRYLGYLQLGAR